MLLELSTMTLRNEVIADCSGTSLDTSAILFIALDNSIALADSACVVEDMLLELTKATESTMAAKNEVMEDSSGTLFDASVNLVMALDNSIALADSACVVEDMLLELTKATESTMALKNEVIAD